ATVINPSSWYKKEDSPNPFSYPGSQVIAVPSDRIYTASRVTGGDKLNWLQVDVATHTDPYPSAELQNFAVAVYMARESTVYVEAACSEPTELEVVLSLSKDPFDFSLYYVARLAVPGLGIPIGRTFTPAEFLLWDTANTSWHPHIADNAVYTYQGDGGSATTSIVTEIINGIPRQVSRIDLYGFTMFGGYAGSGLVLIGAVPKFPLRIYVKHEGTDGTARIAVTVDGTKYYYILEKADWQELVLPAVVFRNVFGDDSTPANDIITGIEIIAAFGSTTTWIWWTSAAPNELPAPVQTYKAALVSRITGTHTFWSGDFTAINSPSEQLKYSPGVVPFTANTVGDGQGGQVIDAWRGIPMSGYQYPAYYVKRGYWDRLDQVLNFLLDAQEAYREQNENNTNGPFAPAFAWGYWDAGEYSPNGIDQWTWVAVDPNSSWEGYYCRPWESVCHAWYLLSSGQYPGLAPTNLADLVTKAGKASMQFAYWLSRFYVNRRNFQPPTDFKQTIDPEVNYHTPHFAAFALRAALYCNLAGGDPATTLRLIKASYDYLRCEYIDSGLMAGSFFKSQPTFTHNGLSYKEGFGFWMSEISQSIAELKIHKDALRYPKCVYFIKKA
ncbi:MAG: hypothetical protein F6K31_36235, partial [Symploca sp. SIO2G7]|nr:hypothetical protein [Symploca sp. SIO2G7]